MPKVFRSRKIVSLILTIFLICIILWFFFGTLKREGVVGSKYKKKQYVGVKKPRYTKSIETYESTPPPMNKNDLSFLNQTSPENNVVHYAGMPGYTPDDDNSFLLIK